MSCFEINAPQYLDADITLPASKSISNRALIIHALSGGKTLPDNLSDCDDTRVVLDALRSMPDVIDIGAAGTAMRFLTAYLAVTDGEHTLTGSERMLHRPIGLLVEALRMLGADITYLGEPGYPPLRIRGHRLEGGKLEIPGNISSQFISALLLIGPAMRNGLELNLTGEIVSRPYIDLTLSVMKAYGADVAWNDADTITVRPKPYAEHAFHIENDWSAAGYWYEMASFYGRGDTHIALQGLMDGSRQGDSTVRYIFSLLGVRTTFDNPQAGELTTVRLSRHLEHVDKLAYDFTNCPDLVQTVTATCCALGIPFSFTGVANLRIKETDRIEALQRELRKLGFVLRTDENLLSWNGARCRASFKPIDTYNDHRMAMAFAPLAVKFPGIRINHPEVVSKSYTHFWDDLRKAQFSVRELDADGLGDGGIKEEPES